MAPINLGYKVFDLHVHLRNSDVSQNHLAESFFWGIQTVVYMPNVEPCLDNATAIKEYDLWLNVHQNRPLPTSAITIGREGKSPVDVSSIRDLVVGFTDDGNSMTDYDIAAHMLKQDVLLMPHCQPETEMVEKYLEVLARVGRGKLHIQHVSLATTVELIRNAKKTGLKFTAETCPHYCYYQNELESHPVNPPLGSGKDLMAIREGLEDGTIDAFASDFAPLPRPKATGFASFATFLPLCYGLFLDGTITAYRLKELLHTNPRKIIASGNLSLLA